MADLAVTAANVVAAIGGVRINGIAGEAIAAGQAVYLDPVGRRIWLADNDAGAVAAQAPLGVALNTAAAGQPVFVLKSGDITIGATLTPGATYFLSDQPGGICPRADIGPGESICLIGLARSSLVLAVAIQFLGIATPDLGGLLDFSQPSNSGYVALIGDF